MEKNSAKNEQRLYKDLAKLFPIITPVEDYAEESEYFSQVIKNTSPIEAKTLFNLGCGGGHNDFTLKKHFKVTGVDLSKEMLKLAKKLNPEVAYIEGDMRTVRIKKSFDAVTLFDSVNYMLTAKDLKAVFQTAYDHLKPGGTLLTVIEETPDRFKQNLTRVSTQRHNGTEVTFIENLYDPDPNDTTYELTLLYLIRSKGELEIETDRHRCGIFGLQTWLDLLQETGFQVNQMEFNASDPEARKYPMLVCVKPQE